MKKAAKLDAWLTARGFAPRKDGTFPFVPAMFSWDLLDEDAQDVPDQLGKRGWVLWFDSQDNFAGGGNALAARTLLDVAGVKDATVAEQSFAGQGLVLTVARGDQERHFFEEDRAEYPEAEPRPDLILTATRWLAEEAGHRVVLLRTGDQTVRIACLPADVLAELQQQKFLTPLGDKAAVRIRCIDAPAVTELAARTAARAEADHQLNREFLDRLRPPGSR